LIILIMFHVKHWGVIPYNGWLFIVAHSKAVLLGLLDELTGGKLARR
jgi:hypothetical protein